MGKDKEHSKVRRKLFRYDLTLYCVACIIFPFILPNIIFEKIRELFGKNKRKRKPTSN